MLSLVCFMAARDYLGVLRKLVGLRGCLRLAFHDVDVDALRLVALCNLVSNSSPSLENLAVLLHFAEDGSPPPAGAADRRTVYHFCREDQVVDLFRAPSLDVYCSQGKVRSM